MTLTLQGTTYPTRFREAEERNRLLARPLLRFTGTDPVVDQALMDRLGTALGQTDQLGAGLAQAMRLPAGHPDRVTLTQVNQALRRASQACGRGETGIDPQADAGDTGDAGMPAVLGHFMAQVSQVPEWVDWERVEGGAAAYRYLGKSASDVLLQLSLIGGYRFGGPADLLVKTGYLVGHQTLRRLGETQQWGLAVTQPGGMRRGAAGWQLTVHVRVMHAMVNARFADRWDCQRWGLPINQADQAGTLGLFDATVILGCRSLGVPMSRRQRDDLMHLWRYVGWLMGVHPDYLTDLESERHKINYHILLSAPDQTQAGRDLARASVDAQAERTFGHRSARLEGLHQRYARARTLSMLGAFLGRESMRQLGLPLRLPWAFFLALAANTCRYRILGALPGGRARNQRHGARAQARGVASSFGERPAQIGRLADVA